VVIVMTGPPGSGKGTQSKRLAAELGIPHLSTGDLLREEVSHDSALGRELSPVLETGCLVPDDTIIRLVGERLRDKPAAVLDGFPRTVAQAEALDVALARSKRVVDMVIVLEVAAHDLLARIAARGREQGRSDDTETAMRLRLREYEEKTAPVVEHYRRRGVKVVSVDGAASPEEVEARVRRLTA
jgi:adenylate kinase